MARSSVLTGSFGELKAIQSAANLNGIYYELVSYFDSSSPLTFDMLERDAPEWHSRIREELEKLPTDSRDDSQLLRRAWLVAMNDLIEKLQTTSVEVKERAKSSSHPLEAYVKFAPVLKSSREDFDSYVKRTIILEEQVKSLQDQIKVLNEKVQILMVTYLFYSNLCTRTLQ